MLTLIVKRIQQGYLEVPGKREPLAFGESHTYLNELPEKVKYLIGSGDLQLTTVESPKVMEAKKTFQQKAEKPKPEKTEKEP